MLGSRCRAARWRPSRRAPSPSSSRSGSCACEDPLRATLLALEVQRGVDQVLQRLRARDATFLGHVADEHHARIEVARHLGQVVAHGADLRRPIPASASIPGTIIVCTLSRMMKRGLTSLAWSTMRPELVVGHQE